MIVHFDSSDNPPGREHPWIDAASSPDAHYHNFVQHPELIPEVLEDFRPLAGQQAVQAFYDLLRWLNGPASPFETNDCGLLAPRVDPKAPDTIRARFEADPIVIHGRLTVLFRNLKLNASAEHVAWLKKCVHDGLTQGVEDFPAVVFVGDWPHCFTEIGRSGTVVNLRYWAWGSDPALAYHNLAGIYLGFRGLFPSIAEALKPKQP